MFKNETDPGFAGFYKNASETMFHVKERAEKEFGMEIGSALAFAVPRKGNKFAARIAYFVHLPGKRVPVPLWAGIVSERTFVKLHDARNGIFGFLSQSIIQKGVANGVR